MEISTYSIRTYVGSYSMYVHTEKWYIEYTWVEALLLFPCWKRNLTTILPLPIWRHPLACSHLWTWNPTFACLWHVCLFPSSLFRTLLSIIFLMSSLYLKVIGIRFKNFKQMSAVGTQSLLHNCEKSQWYRRLIPTFTICFWAELNALLQNVSESTMPSCEPRLVQW